MQTGVAPFPDQWACVSLLSGSTFFNRWTCFQMSDVAFIQSPINILAHDAMEGKTNKYCRHSPHPITRKFNFRSGLFPAITTFHNAPRHSLRDFLPVCVLGFVGQIIVFSDPPQLRVPQTFQKVDGGTHLILQPPTNVCAPVELHT